VAGGTPLQIIGTHLGWIDWRSSGESILDGVSIVSQDDRPAATFLAFSGQPLRLLVLRSRLVGGSVGLSTNAVKVQIESSIVTGRNAPACTAYDADGTPVGC